MIEKLENTLASLTTSFHSPPTHQDTVILSFKPVRRKEKSPQSARSSYLNIQVLSNHTLTANFRWGK
jgi:hypothetical protein